MNSNFFEIVNNRTYKGKTLMATIIRVAACAESLVQNELTLGHLTRESARIRRVNHTDILYPLIIFFCDDVGVTDPGEIDRIYYAILEAAKNWLREIQLEAQRIEKEGAAEQEKPSIKEIKGMVEEFREFIKQGKAVIFPGKGDKSVH